MSSPIRSVPFIIKSLFGGLGQCHGMVYDEGDHFRFEFQTKDSLCGILKTDVKQVKIPVTQVVAVDLVKGLLGITKMGVKIVMQSASLDAFKLIPGMNHGKIELSVVASNANLAEEFVNGLYRNS